MRTEELNKIFNYVLRLPCPDGIDGDYWRALLEGGVRLMAEAAGADDWEYFIEGPPIPYRLSIVELLAKTSLPLEKVQLALAACWVFGRRRPDIYELPQARTVRLFRSVGFFSNADLPCPTANLRLFRAATPEKSAGLSWTPDIWLAAYLQDYTSGRVFVADVPPRRLLAHYVGHPLVPTEFVVDTQGLDIRPMSRTELRDEFVNALDARLVNYAA